eukprot:COSAG05_NODE_2066_length_3619_cov_2.043466_5_plen_314_part_00
MNRLRRLGSHVAPSASSAAQTAAASSTTPRNLRSRRRTSDPGLEVPPGRTAPPITWAAAHEAVSVDVSKTAVVIIDMWDFHPCPCAFARFREIAVKIEDTVASARAAGVLIIHAPSDCVGGYTGAPVKPAYADHPARKWVAALPHRSTPPPREQNVPKYPLDSSDGGCDCAAPATSRTWERVTDLITIHDTDALIDGNDGQSLHNLVAARGLTRLLYCGVATNMCVMGRQAAIVTAKSWGLQANLVRELTDVMYNPELPPYLDTHEAGTELFIRFLEKEFADAESGGGAGWTGVPTLSRFDLMGHTDPYMGSS